MTFFISVIIPVFNNQDDLNACLGALSQQTYPQDLYEVIVVDNGSTSDIKGVVSRYEQIKLMLEPVRGSYAARNRGLSIAKGEIIAFTDSDCLPVSNWLESGERAFTLSSADLVGGQVSFQLSAERTAAEIYDSVTNMQIKRDIAMRQVSKTANLFVRKKVFEAVGLFPNEVQSGGDVTWTKRATNAGFSLVYSSEAKVFHPARKFSALLQKQYRVGKGQPAIWIEQGQSIREITVGCLKALKPPKISELVSNIELVRQPEVKSRKFSIFIVMWLCNITMVFGRLNGVSKLGI